MERVKLEIEVTKEIYEVGKAIQTVLTETKKALADGVDVTDIPSIIAASIGDLSRAISGLSSIPAEFIGDPIEAVQGVINPVLLGVRALIKKAE